jgi:MFS family permease
MNGLRNHIATSARALRYRNYRLFFTGQAVSLIGTWMTRLASSWLVYRLTADPFVLGIVNFAGLVPTFVLGPFAGVYVDRTSSLRRLILVTQFAAMVQSIGLVAAAAIPMPASTAVALLIFLNLLQGIINAFDMPARQAFLPSMVTRPEDLANGIALNSALFNAARLIGPALAGILIKLVGEVGCFAIDAVSYAGVLYALQLIDAPDIATPQRKERRFWGGFLEGLRYAWGFESIRALLILVAVLSFMGMPYVVLMPVYAKEILHGGPETLGWLTSSAGVGAIVGALLLAGRESVDGIGKLIVFAGCLFAIGLAVFAFSTRIDLSCIALLAVGFGVLMQTASSNTVLQTVVEPDKRGRIMSLYSMAFVGVGPFGGLAAGWAASRFGAPATLGVSAAVCLVSTGFFAWRLPAVRRAAERRTAARAAAAPGGVG